MGDKVLKQVSARLWGSTRENDVLARLGGDEFSLLLRGIDNPAEAAGQLLWALVTGPEFLTNH